MPQQHVGTTAGMAGRGGSKSTRAGVGRHWGAIGALVLIFAAASLLLVWRNTPIDDAFISYRYARNLSAGNGAVFNPGERVEGYSSLSWLLILALGGGIGADLPSLSKLLGLLLGAACLLLLAAAPFPWRTRLAAAALLSVHAPFLYHSANGLETSLMTFLLTALVLLPLAPAGSKIGAPVVAGLMVLTRPEGLMAVLAWHVCAAIAHGSRLGGRLLSTSLVASAVFLAHTIGRWAYYGDWIPNSARAKLLPLWVALPHGLLDWLGYLWNGGAWGALLLLGGFGAIFGREHRPAVSIAAFVLGFSLILATSGGDGFPLWRFFVPLAPLLMLCAGHGLVVIFFGATGLRRSATRSLGFGVALGAIALALALPLRSHQAAMESEKRWALHWERLGRRLAELLPPDTIIALCPVGALPYYSGFEVVDMLGLTDATVARAAPDPRYYYPGHQRHDAAYVLSREPDLLMLANGPVMSHFDDRFPWDQVRIYESDVLEDERFRRDYRLIHIPLDAETSIGLFARKDFAARVSGLIREGTSRGWRDPPMDSTRSDEFHENARPTSAGSSARSVGAAPRLR